MSQSAIFLPLKRTVDQTMSENAGFADGWRDRQINGTEEPWTPVKCHGSTSRSMMMLNSICHPQEFARSFATKSGPCREAWGRRQPSPPASTRALPRKLVSPSTALASFLHPDILCRALGQHLGWFLSTCLHNLLTHHQ
jgi:hypothetical protein